MPEAVALLQDLTGKKRNDDIVNPALDFGAYLDLGGMRYVLTGSTGETTEIKAYVNTIKSPSSDPASFKKLDAHNSHMDREDKDDDTQMTRTYTVSR